jgi:ATP-dependent DNA helicase RecG
MKGKRTGDEAEERMACMVETTDGFKIAEKDLELRGPGEFIGTRQSGLPSLKVANLLRDGRILEAARQEAIDFVGNPSSSQEFEAVVAQLRANWQRRYGLAVVA